MILGGEESVEMEVEGIKLEQVKSFKYLSSGTILFSLLTQFLSKN